MEAARFICTSKDGTYAASVPCPLHALRIGKAEVAKGRAWEPEGPVAKMTTIMRQIGEEGAAAGPKGKTKKKGMPPAPVRRGAAAVGEEQDEEGEWEEVGQDVSELNE
jgi:hypothetical protein